jgi:hypothetical protein
MRPHFLNTCISISTLYSTLILVRSFSAFSNHHLISISSRLIYFISLFAVAGLSMASLVSIFHHTHEVSSYSDSISLPHTSTFHLSGHVSFLTPTRVRLADLICALVACVFCSLRHALSSLVVASRHHCTRCPLISFRPSIPPSIPYSGSILVTFAIPMSSRRPSSAVP